MENSKGGVQSTLPTESSGASAPPLPTNPTWKDIAALFQSPFWLPDGDRTIVGSYWILKMRPYNLNLDQYPDVSTQAKVIYDAIYSGDMPRTYDSTEKFPPEAVALFKTWMDNNCPE
ncbi:uncharacterized protein H6S33_007242 [Morchella sextelata]|jgi:hypothetical protein|uniref:uncharacterized protein n=1 Tax=Morchella sextelata TaxID=1174677 RepID=UPI001D0581D2|nr:uncharacterized protein H6S33_007242 [Morchella sextelata]KAH0604211.1 hypothetical protein H6S33_007242 [Morchella sextelata]